MDYRNEPAPHDPIPARKRSGATPFLLIALAVVALALVWRYGLDGGGPDLVQWTEDYEAGLAAARAQGKPALVVFTASWCGPCQSMKRNVYSQPEVADAIHGRVVPIKVDVTRRPAPPAVADLAARYGVSGIPALYLADAEGNPFAHESGYMNGNELIAWLNTSSPPPPTR